MEAVDLLVIGAGLPGLHTALHHRREHPDARILVVDEQPWPGDDVRTQRSNGFVCELGPFAFTSDELGPHFELLARPPRAVEAVPTGRRGWLFDGEARAELEVHAIPLSFTTGCEELVQAYRRELDGTLRLGREGTALRPIDDGPAAPGYVCELGGEAAASVRAERVVLAIGTGRAARLLQAFDPALARTAEQLDRAPRAFVFFGGLTKDAPELRGYGTLPADGVDTSIAEVIHCTEVFARRALPDRCLVRVELDGHERDDDTLAQRALAELRRWTGTTAEFGVVKVHRFDVAFDDGATVECRVRIADLAQRLPGLTMLA